MRFGFVLAATLTVSAGAQVSSAPPVCNVHTYGAKGDGTTKDTAAIQKAIDDCSAKKGTVVVAGGKFVTGPLELKSNVTLSVSTGAELLASVDRDDYKPATIMRLSGVQAFLHVDHADHVTITGGGTIDGRGQVWWDYVKGAKDGGVLGNDHPRPFGLYIDHSTRFTMQNVTFQNAGFWQVVPYYSDYLKFSHIRILAPQRGAPNTDGLDPFSSSHIDIDHYFSSVGDDNIAIKSGAINSPGPDTPSTDINIVDCQFEAGHGLSIGSEVSGGAQRIHGERISFKGTDNGIRVKSNRDRGADVSDLSFKDITMQDVRTSILISEYYPKAMPEGDVAAAPVQRLTPHFHNITIENLVSKDSEWAGVIVGLPEAPVLAVTLKNVQIESERGMQIGYATVVLKNVDIDSEEDKPITKGAAANVTGK